MRVYKCDRCWKYVSLSERDLFLRKPTPLWRLGRKMHLCDDCAKSFREWFNFPDEKEGNDDSEA